MITDTVHAQIIQSTFMQVDWDSIVRIATVIITFLNMIIVLIIFKATRKLTLKSILFEKKAIWYRNLAIQPNLEIINCFYRNTINILEDGQKNILAAVTANSSHQSILELVQKVVDDFNTEISELRKGFIDILSALNPNFGEKISRLFDDLQDSVNPQMDDLVSKRNVDCINFSDILRKHKVQLFKELYNYELLELLPPR